MTYYPGFFLTLKTEFFLLSRLPSPEVDLGCLRVELVELHTMACVGVSEADILGHSLRLSYRVHIPSLLLI